jgi:hypothetical protein
MHIKALIGHFKRGGWPAGVLLAGLLLGGCATGGTVASRKQERYSAYEALSPEQRSLVDQGKIQTGMSTDAVYIAWGKPGRVTEGDSGAGPAITWAYLDSYLQQYYTTGWHGTYQTYANVPYVRAQVVFTNGLVKQWQTFTAPGF